MPIKSFYAVLRKAVYFCVSFISVFLLNFSAVAQTEVAASAISSAENATADHTATYEVPKGSGLIRYFTLRPSNNGGDWVITDVISGQTFRDRENSNGPVSTFRAKFSYDSTEYQRNCEMAIFVFTIEESVAKQWRFNEKGIVFYGDNKGIEVKVGANGTMLTLTMQVLDELTDSAESKFSFITDYFSRATGTTQMATFVSPDPSVVRVRRP